MCLISLMKGNSFTNSSSVFVKTQQAILSLVDTITKSLDSGDIVIGVVFLDLKKLLEYFF